MATWLRTAACVLAVAGAATLRADDAASLVERGHAQLRLAATGRAEAAAQALATFDAVLEKHPGHAGARAGRGLALVTQALTAPMRAKLGLARRGFAELDAAVAAAPDDATIRLLRATNAAQMPLMLERRPVAEADFARLLVAARDDRVTMAPSTRRGIFYQAAAFAMKERRLGAVELLEEAASVPAHEPDDAQIQSMLALARRQLTSPSHADSQPPEKASASRP